VNSGATSFIMRKCFAFSFRIRD